MCNLINHVLFLIASLKNVLSSANQKGHKNQSLSSVATQVFAHFLKYEKSVLVLSTAVQLQRLLFSLRKLSSSSKDAPQRSTQQAEDIRKCCTQKIVLNIYLIKFLLKVNFVQRCYAASGTIIRVLQKREPNVTFISTNWSRVS